MADLVSSLPDDALSKIMSNLDAESRKNAMAVSRTWQARTTSALESEHVKHASLDALLAFHNLPLAWLVLRVWILAVHRFVFLVDYVREFTAQRILVALRVSAFLMVLYFPLLLLWPAHSWLAVALQMVEVGVLVVPAFTRVVSKPVQFGVLGVLNALLIHLDRPASSAVVVTVLPLVALLMSLWSMLAQRLPSALEAEPSWQPLVFERLSVPVRLLRFIALLYASIHVLPTWSCALVSLVFFALAFKVNRARPFRTLLKMLPVASVALLLISALLVRFSFVRFFKALSLIIPLLWTLSAYSNKWFAGSIFNHHRDFALYFKLTLALLLVSPLLMKLA